MKPLILGLLSLAAFAQQTHAEPNHHRISIHTGSAGASSSQLDNYETHVKSENGDAVMAIYNTFAGFKGDDVHLYYEFLIAKDDIAPILNIDGESHDVTLETTHLHLGGTYEWQTAKYFQPYFGMTFGRSQVDSSTGSSDKFWGFSAATGFNIPVSDHFAIRADARAFLMRWSDDTALLCAVKEDPCTINLNDNSWLHHQITVGATIRF